MDIFVSGGDVAGLHEAFGISVDVGDDASGFARKGKTIFDLKY
jgi:hypothetical protein